MTHGRVRMAVQADERCRQRGGKREGEGAQFGAFFAKLGLISGFLGAECAYINQDTLFLVLYRHTGHPKSHCTNSKQGLGLALNPFFLFVGRELITPVDLESHVSPRALTTTYSS